MKEKADNDYGENQHRKEVAYHNIVVFEQELSSASVDVKKLKKKIDAIEAKAVTTKKKKAAEQDILCDLEVTQEALRVKTNAEENLEHAVVFEKEKIIEMDSFDIPLKNTSKTSTPGVLRTEYTVRTRLAYGTYKVRTVSVTAEESFITITTLCYATH
jgi:hypothetical protein